jgi:hypothetical protein
MFFPDFHTGEKSSGTLCGKKGLLDNISDDADISPSFLELILKIEVILPPPFFFVSQLSYFIILLVASLLLTK